MKKLLFILITTLLISCNNFSSENDTIVIATTTSFVNTGVLDYLIDIYKEENGINIDYLSVGSGKAMELGKADEADVLVLHSSETIENQLILDNYTYERIPFIENKFLIVSIDNNVFNNTFVSRGDKSGTHIRELEIWEQNQKPENYIETGKGMLDTLIIADQIEGTTLIDRGTWLVNKDKTSLKEYDVLEDEYLRNVYSAHTVNTGNQYKEKLALDFVQWLVSDETINLIESYKYEENGESLFYKYKK